MKDFKVWISLIFLMHPGFALSQDAIDASGNFKDPRDKKVVQYVLENFAKECTFVSSFEGIQLRKFEKKFSELNLEKTKESRAYACYETNLPKMRSVAFIYSQMCNSLSFRGIPKNQSKLLAQFVAVQSFKDGISLHHVLLNDCLNKAGSAKRWIVKKEETAFESTGIENSLRDMKVSLPFFPNRMEIR